MAVWDSGLKASLKPTALALARFADDDGGNIFPSLDRIAWLNGKTNRQVRRDIVELLSMRVLTATTSRAGGRHRTTRYRLDAAALPARPPFSAGVWAEKPGHECPPFDEKPGHPRPPLEEEPGHGCPPLPDGGVADVTKPGHPRHETRTSTTENPDMGVRRSVSDLSEKVQEGPNFDSDRAADSQGQSWAESGKGQSTDGAAMPSVRAITGELRGGNKAGGERALLENLRARVFRPDVEERRRRHAGGR